MGKRIISLALVLALVVGICPTVFATGDIPVLGEEKTLALVDALYGVEAQKELIGLADTDFTTLKIGMPIQTYIYTNNMLQPGHMLYPIMSDTELVLWALDLDGKFQITTALVDEIRNRVEDDAPFAIIYDKSSSYLYKDGGASLLKTSSVEDPSRSVFDPNVLHDYSVLQATALLGKEALGYVPYTARAQRYYSCNVQKTLQLPYNALCWAAVTACILNYCNGTSLTAVDVAKRCWDSDTDFNYGIIDATQAQKVLADIYNLPYTYDTKVPSDNEILTNIKNGYPIYSTWNVVYGAKHACCIYAIDIMNGYIYIMDPEYGFTSVAPSGGKYSYVSGYSGATLELEGAACNSWD